MSQTLRINGKKSVGGNKRPVVRKPVLENAQLKYGRAIAVPEVENHGVMIFTEDTGELFIGQGASKPIKKLSSVIMVDSVNELPAPGIKDCLYIALESNTMHFWDGKQYHILNAGAEGSAPITITPHVFEYNLKEDFPAEGSGPAIYIEKDTNKLYRFENGEYKEMDGGLRQKTAKNEQSIIDLKNAIGQLQETKADKGSFISMDEAVKIAKREASKIAIPDISGLATKKEIANMATKQEVAQKASKTDLANKANISEVYTKAEIDQKLSKVQTIKGEAGVDGKDGKDGRDGIDGLDGKDGKDGQDGINGVDGKDGKDGRDGKDGVNGKSAFDIAKENGFVGTEKEWLNSLKGEKGETGAPATPIDTSSFVKKDEMADYAKKEDITGYAKKEELAGFTKKEDLAGYAKKDELPAPKSLAELGGVTQAGVEAIIQAKNFTSEEAVKQMIKEAIAAALKDIPGGTSTPENKPTPKPYKETGNEEYEWIHYFVVPAGKWDISTDINSFFGETITCEDLIGPNDDMTDFKVEIRQLGTLRDNVNKKAAVDDDIQGRTFNIDYTKIWKDGIRCPIRDIVPAEVEEQFQAELDKMSSINMGAIDYDGETVMSTTRTTAGCGTLFMIRKLKNGTFSGYSMGEKIA